jgi:hypothetical protein
MHERLNGEPQMSYLSSLLRSAALAIATLLFVPTSFVAGTATVATVSAVTVMATSHADAKPRPKVRDHRYRRCGGNPNGGRPICS